MVTAKNSEINQNRSLWFYDTKIKIDGFSEKKLTKEYLIKLMKSSGYTIWYVNSDNVMISITLALNGCEPHFMLKECVTLHLKTLIITHCIITYCPVYTQYIWSFIHVTTFYKIFTYFWNIYEKFPTTPDAILST